MTSTVPAACAGEVAVICESELIENEAPVPPKLTDVALKKPLPEMVTDVPPPVLPALGLREVTTGGPKVYLSPLTIDEVPAALVTVISTVPAACEGEVAVICPSVLIVKDEALLPPKTTDVALVKPLPEIVTEVPPPVLPAPGLTDVTTGGPKVYLSPLTAVEVPLALVTKISTVPADSEGEVAVIWVPELTVKLVAAVVPNLTAVAPPKPVPVMTTDVPPAVVPAFGLMDVTTGLPKVNRSAVEVGEVPAGLVTVTSTEPAACAGEWAVICVLEFTVKLAAAVLPKLTADTDDKFVPVMVTVVPPPVEPAAGLIEVIVGGKTVVAA